MHLLLGASEPWAGNGEAQTAPPPAAASVSKGLPSWPDSPCPEALGSEGRWGQCGAPSGDLRASAPLSDHTGAFRTEGLDASGPLEGSGLCRALGSPRPPGLSRAGRMERGSSCQSSEVSGSSPTPRLEAPPLGPRRCGLFRHKSYWGGRGAFHFSSHSHSPLGPERVWLREGACGQGALVGVSLGAGPGCCASKTLPAASSPVCSPSRRWACCPGRGRGHVWSFVS